MLSLPDCLNTRSFRQPRDIIKFVPLPTACMEGLVLSGTDDGTINAFDEKTGQFLVEISNDSGEQFNIYVLILA